MLPRTQNASHGPVEDPWADMVAEPISSARVARVATSSTASSERGMAKGQKGTAQSTSWFPSLMQDRLSRDELQGTAASKGSFGKDTAKGMTQDAPARWRDEMQGKAANNGTAKGMANDPWSTWRAEAKGPAASDGSFTKGTGKGMAQDPMSDWRDEVHDRAASNGSSNKWATRGMVEDPPARIHTSRWKDEMQEEAASSSSFNQGTGKGMAQDTPARIHTARWKDEVQGTAASNSSFNKGNAKGMTKDASATAESSGSFSKGTDKGMPQNQLASGRAEVQGTADSNSNVSKGTAKSIGQESPVRFEAGGLKKGCGKSKAGKQESPGKGQYGSGKTGRPPQEIEAFVQEHRLERIRAGHSVFSQELIVAIQKKFGLNPQSCQSISDVSSLARFEQGFNQFLLSMRAHAVIWSVVDLEVSFLRSNLQKRDIDIKEWASLHVGPFHQHPKLTEVFPEFQAAQSGWSQAPSPPALLSAVDVLLALYQHRNDVGFKNRVLLADFVKWFEQTKGAPMDRLGVAINPEKLGLIFAGQNSALSENKRIRKDAQERYLLKLTDMVEKELQDMLRESSQPSTDLRMQADIFLNRWRHVAKKRPFGDTLAALNLWAQHVLDAELPPFVNCLTAAFITMLSAENALGDGETTALPSATVCNASPLELADAVRRYLDAMPTGCGLDSQGLLRLEETVAGSAGTVEAVLPGTSLLRLVAESEDLRMLLDCRLQAPGASSAASSSPGLPVDALLEAIAAALQERLRQSGVIDLQLAADVESFLRRRLGASKIGDWAGYGSLSTLLCQTAKKSGRAASCITSQGWALRCEDCTALSLWQRHALRVERAGGLQALASHFGTEQQTLAVGLPPRTQTATLQPHRSGLYFEAVALTHLKTRCGKNLLAGHDVADDDAALEAAAAEAEADMQMLSSCPTVGLLGEKDAQAALAAINSVGFLEDVEVATAWTEVFAPSLGPLIDFVEDQDEAGALVDSGLRLLAIAPRCLSTASLAPRLVRLPPYVETDGNQLLCQAIADGDANLAAAYLTALSVDAPNDVLSLSYYLDCGLVKLANGYRNVKNYRSAFCIAMLFRLPSAFREVVGEVVILPALQKEVGWAANAVCVAERLACVPMLALLGHRWHVQEWSALLLRVPPAEKDSSLFLRALGALGASLDSGTHEALCPTSLPADASNVATTSGSTVKEVSSSPLHGAERFENDMGAQLDMCISSGPVKGTDESSALCIDREDQQQYCQIIEEIRRGFLLNDDRASQLQLNLGGSLQRLGDDLYREQHHFVFELLQNATDCNYPPGVVPHFKLILQSGQLVALSNEVGFSEKDVRALCAVDSSTKPSLSDGRERIGRKGIGFKSVFKISDRPTIHSGPWHFHFDAQLPSRHGKSLKGLGYIVPHQLSASDKQFDGWTTEIRLPFKAGLDEGERAHLQRDLEALNGVLLLNLRSMRCVELVDDTALGRPLRKLQRWDLHEHRHADLTWRIVEISDSGRWLCIEDAFPFETDSQKKIHITLSFPLPIQQSTSEWARAEMALLPTYCYLPLRSFGWKVALHANFDVTASRNEIHDNSPWNVKIKQRLPLMFVRAMQLAKEKLMLPPQPMANLDEPREPLKAVAMQNPEVSCVPYSFIFKFLPLPGALGGGEGDFFSGVEAKIWERLKRERCVLSSEGEWVEPSRALCAPTKMQQIITSDLLKKYHKGMHYLHPEFEGITPEVARQLGIGTEAAAFTVLVAVVRGLVEAEDPLSKNASWVQSVLLLAYVLIYGDGKSSHGIGIDRLGLVDIAREKLKSLRSLRFLPVVGGASLVAPDEDQVFLPSQKALVGLSGSLVHRLGLKLIDPQLIAPGHEGDMVRRLLGACDLKDLSPLELLVDGVLPFLRQDRGGQQLETLSDCIWYLAEQCDRFVECDALLHLRAEEQEEEFSVAVKRALRLPCRLGSHGDLHFVAAGTPVVLPAAFHSRLAAEVKDQDVSAAHKRFAAAAGNDIWEGVLCVDECVLQCTSSNAASFQNFVVFLQSLGATLGMFPVELKEVCIETADALSQIAPWLTELVPEDADYPATLNDASSSALSHALKTENSMMPVLVAASFMLGLCDHLSASISFKEAGKHTGPSTVKQELQSAAWIPSEGGQLVMPSEIHIQSPDVPAEVRKHFKFVDTSFSASNVSGKLLECFNVHALKAEDLLELLRQWSSSRSSLTEGEIEATYTFLYSCQKKNKSDVDIVHAAFVKCQEPLIFIPKEPRWTKASWERKSKWKNVLSGKWVQVQDCCIMKAQVQRRELGDSPWLSTMGAVRELELHYALCLKEPFKAFGVTEIVSFSQLFRSIEMSGQMQSFDSALMNMTYVLQWLLNTYHLSSEEHSAIRGILAQYKAIPTEGSKWVAWLCKEEGSMESADHAVEVYLPSEFPGAQGHFILHRGISRYRPLFAQLGMREASGADVADVSVANPVMAENSEVNVDASEKMDGTSIEGDLRISMAYLQCWFNHNPDCSTCVDRCNQQVETLQNVEIEVYQRLRVNSADVPAYWEGSSSVLHVVHAKRGEGLRPALQQLLRHALSLDPKSLVGIEKVGVDLLIRLADADRPGRAAQQLLIRAGFPHADPAAMNLNWWFRVPPLPLEERMLTLGSPLSLTGIEGGCFPTGARPTGAGSSNSMYLEGAINSQSQHHPTGRPQHFYGEPHTKPVDHELQSSSQQPSSQESTQMESSWLSNKVKHILRTVRQIQHGAEMQSQDDVEVVKQDRDRHIAELQSWINAKLATPEGANMNDRFTSNPSEGRTDGISDAWTAWAHQRAQQIADVASTINQQRADGTPLEEAQLAVCQDHAQELTEWTETGKMPELHDGLGNGSSTPASWARARADHLDALAECLQKAYAGSQEESGQRHNSENAVHFCRGHASELRRLADSRASSLNPPPGLDPVADPWAKWAQQRAQQTSDAVAELEQLWPDEVHSTTKGQCMDGFQKHAAALRRWAATGKIPEFIEGSRGGASDRVQWAEAQADNLDSLAAKQERCLPGLMDGRNSAQFCREHASELRKWAESGALVIDAPPGLGAELSSSASASAMPHSSATLHSAWHETTRLCHLSETIQAIEKLTQQKQVGNEIQASLMERLDSLQALAGQAFEPSEMARRDQITYSNFLDVDEVEHINDAQNLMPTPLHDLPPANVLDEQVGRWGEEWVYRYLRSQHHATGAQVIWLNEAREQFRPYDISVAHADSSIDYYEVKATVKFDKLIQISEAEILEAKRQAEHFTLVRVYAAGQSAAKMSFFRNVSAKWQNSCKANSGVELFVRVPVPCED